MIQNKQIKRLLTVNGKPFQLGDKTLIMGILNVTPDSFSDGGQFNQLDLALTHSLEMIIQGADIIDVGGESTRPGSLELQLEEELQRIVPIIESLSNATRKLISIDSYKARVAEKALSCGADIINDVWGFHKDNDMARVAADFQVPTIIMHNQDGTVYSKDMIDSMKHYFDFSIELALKKGLNEDLIILDPGIGFGKTAQQNFEVLARLDEIKAFGYPVLLGTSRKSMFGKLFDLPLEERLEATLATNVAGILAGCEIIRVHDIKEHLRIAQVADAIVRGKR